MKKEEARMWHRSAALVYASCMLKVRETECPRQQHGRKREGKSKKGNDRQHIQIGRKRKKWGQKN